MKIIYVFLLLALVSSKRLISRDPFLNCIQEKCSDQLKTCNDSPDCIDSFSNCLDKSAEEMNDCLSQQNNEDASSFGECAMNNCGDKWSHQKLQRKL